MIARVVIETLQIKFLLSTVTVQDLLPEFTLASFHSVTQGQNPGAEHGDTEDDSGDRSVQPGQCDLPHL